MNARAAPHGQTRAAHHLRRNALILRQSKRAAQALRGTARGIAHHQALVAKMEKKIRVSRKIMKSARYARHQARTTLQAHIGAPHRHGVSLPIFAAPPAAAAAASRACRSIVHLPLCWRHRVLRLAYAAWFTSASRHIGISDGDRYQTRRHHQKISSGRARQISRNAYK